MTPIAAQDRNKAIALSAAVVLVFGFAIWRISSMSGSSTPPPEVHLDSPKPVASNPAADAAKTSGTAVDVVLPVSAGLIDPFRSVLPARSAAASPGPGTDQPRPRTISGALAGVAPVTITPTGNVPDVAADPKLVGVMTGDDPLAVFLENGKEVILHVGDKLDSGYLIESIGANSADLRRKGKHLTVIVSPGK